MPKKEYWIGFAAGAAAALAGCISGITLNHILQADRGYVLSDPARMAHLESLEDLIDEYYLGETDDEKLADGVYKGLIAGLNDKYSCYYTAEEYARDSEDSKGYYEGIGILMTGLPDGTILVLECYEGGPGKEAGLREQDIITKIDEIDVTGISSADVIEYIRGKSGGSVKLTVSRQNEYAEDQKSREILEITVPVSNVEMASVYSDIMEDGIGYLQITEFKSVTYHQFCEEYEKLRQQGMKKLIIDLRDNPGGYVDVVCDILRQILPEGLIVYTEDKYGARNEEFCEGSSPIDIPLVVLVNGGSASASEIFAGAVKDYKIGTIVGTTTYGKGVVQSVRSYRDGSAVKLTTSHYYTPLGHDINEIGIEPDIVVELAGPFEEDSDRVWTDLQLEKAMELLKNTVK